jgi:hypothetical protein
VTPHGIDLAHNRDTQAGVRFGDGNGCSESCASAAYHDNVVICNHIIYARKVIMREIMAKPPEKLQNMDGKNHP